MQSAGITVADPEVVQGVCSIRLLQTTCMHVYRHECVCIHVLMYGAYFSTIYNLSHKCMQVKINIIIQCSTINKQYRYIGLLSAW